MSFAFVNFILIAALPTEHIRGAFGALNVFLANIRRTMANDALLIKSVHGKNAPDALGNLINWAVS
jgi:hypothetical protein